MFCFSVLHYSVIVGVAVVIYSYSRCSIILRPVRSSVAFLFLSCSFLDNIQKVIQPKAQGQYSYTIKMASSTPLCTWFIINNSRCCDCIFHCIVILFVLSSFVRSFVFFLRWPKFEMVQMQIFGCLAARASSVHVQIFQITHWKHFMSEKKMNEPN